MPSPFRTKKANAAAGTRREARDTARTPANGVGGAHAEPRATVHQAHRGPITPLHIKLVGRDGTEQLLDGEIACRQALAEHNFINCFRLQTVHPQLPWPPSSPFIPVSESHYLSLSVHFSIPPFLSHCSTILLSFHHPSIHSCPSIIPSSVLQFFHPSVPVLCPSILSPLFPFILPSLCFPLLVSFPGIQRAAHQAQATKA